MKQRTIKKSVEIVGIGLHKGIPIKMTLEPLPHNSGIIFFRNDKNISIPLNIQNVVDTQMATVIGKDGTIVSTIEHLLSAIYSYGIDNLRIVLNNDEVPVLDGSSSGFCMLLDEVGIQEQTATKKAILIKKEISVKDGKKFATLKPSNHIIYDFSINFDHPAIGEQNFRFEYSIEQYKENISRARTFGFLHEVQYMQNKGLALGASLDNAIGLDDQKILNPEGLRYDNEFVRHKILDAIGDMSLLGYTMIGEYNAYAGSHHLNHLLTKKLLADSANYEIVDLEEKEQTNEAKNLKMAYAKVINS
jgi:UDP-3-O-[3-hydroxymyristoyl] N-acetylglucosamine deacetylase